MNRPDRPWDASRPSGHLQKAEPAAAAMRPPPPGGRHRPTTASGDDESTVTASADRRSGRDNAREGGPCPWRFFCLRADSDDRQQAETFFKLGIGYDIQDDHHTPKDTVMLKAAVSKKLRAITARHRASWRQWAHDIASGKPEPTANDVVEVALALGIEDPGADLERDADIVREVISAGKTTAACERERQELLRPFGGDAENIRIAIDVAKAEVTRLTALYDSATWAGEWAIKAEADRLRRSRPDLFSE
jgi:hypothetical protein